ncbi:hypothetical protein EDD11_009880 [Mortierella claussenii]|nr:hypothetical protein EDD11_009880 [Mortierella claussenii]
MLASGSLYVFALYAPSFTGHLAYTQTQTSMIAVIGDIGLYGVGPVSGLMADRLGPRLTSFVAGTLLALGYGLLSVAYTSSVESVKNHQPPIHFLWMAFFLSLAGTGSSASYMAAFTSLAKNFTQARGIALGIPVSFFGLSAAALTLIAQSYFMTEIGQQLQRGLDSMELDTAKFLLFLGIAGGLINAMSAVCMKILPEPQIIDLLQDGPGETVSAPVQAHQDPQQHTSLSGDNDEQTPLLRDDPLTSLTAQGQDQTIGAELASEVPPEYQLYDAVRPISGKEFFLDRDAQAFFLVMVCLAGTGLMIINSITAMVDAVAASQLGNPLVGRMTQHIGDKSPVASIRALHVGLISLSSYVGRIMAGLGSDVAIHRYGVHRVYVLPVATACMALAQVVGMFASLRWLYLCSILTGLAYGGFFGVAGIIVAELWGAETCGQNWGWLSWGSALGGMLFNLLFGIVMDAARPVVDGEPQTCKGHKCFRWALLVSFSACILSCLLGVVMSIRQKRAHLAVVAAAAAAASSQSR